MKLKNIILENRFFWITLALAFFYFQSFSQRKAGNEWINFSQSYYKIKVIKDGIYRLGYADLTAAGVPVASINPANVQVFFRGQEIPIFVSAKSGSFGSSDYIQFYGIRNDGLPDTVLYADPSIHYNRAKSYYSDTSAYFLTWGSTAGKRIEGSTYSGGGTLPAYYMEEKKISFTESLQDGAPVQTDVFDPEYTITEGWQSYYFNTNQEKAVNFRPTAYFSGADRYPEVEFVVYGRSHIDGAQGYDHHMVVKAGPASSLNKQAIADEYYMGYTAVQRNIGILPSAIDQNQDFSVTFTPTGPYDPSTDYNSLAYVTFRYPRLFNQLSYRDTVFNYYDSSGSSKIYFRFAGPGLSQNNLVLYDLTHGYLCNPVRSVNGDTVKYAVPNPGQPSRYLLCNETVFTTIGLKKVNFIKYDLSQNYNFLMVAPWRLYGASQQYANYKNTQKIDSNTHFKVLLVQAEQLYDQFFYGIYHAAAIQNFAGWFYHQSGTRPVCLLLVGKGNRLPVLGNPVSDILYTSGVDNYFVGPDSTKWPTIPIGRIPANAGSDVLSYLSKLKEYDAAGAGLWHKNFLHISGAYDTEAQKKFTYWMTVAGFIVQGKQIGGNVTTVFSTNKNQVITDYRSLIQGYLNNGMGMLTYLGHGSASQLMVDFGRANTLKNKGRYPIISVNGCGAGALSEDTSLNWDNNQNFLGENFVLAPNKGAIAWMGHTQKTLDGILNAQIDTFYTLISKNMYGSMVGDVCRETMRRVLHSSSEAYRANLEEWTYQGDPTIRYHFLPKPDYAVFDSTLFISPKNVIAKTDAFDVGIPVYNAGMTGKDSIPIKVVQTLPDRRKIAYPAMLIPPVKYKDIAYFHILRGTNNLQGLNHFDITLDPDTTLDEYTRSNNRASFDYYFSGTGARSLFPTDFNIVPKDSPAITIQSRNVLDKKVSAYFELDTVPFFNSPVKISAGPVPGYNLVTWHPRLPVRKGNTPKDSQVYYWRSRLNLPFGSGGDWDITRSFTYIKGSPTGWSQSHYYQYQTIDFKNMQLDSNTHAFDFRPSFEGVTLNMNAWNAVGLGIKPDPDYVQNYQVQSSTTLIFIEFDHYTFKYVNVDPVTGEPYRTYWKGNYYPVNYRQFNMCNSDDRDSFVVDMGRVKDGNYVAMISFPTHPTFCMNDWKPEVFGAFHKIGSHMLDKVHDSSARFAFVSGGQKFETGGVLLGEDMKYDTSEIRASDGSEDAYAKIFMTGYDTSGSLTSVRIGPAAKWHRLKSKFKSLEDPTSDTVKISVYGYDASGVRTLLLPNIMDTGYDLSGISAKTYPYLELSTREVDRIKHNPSQLKLWQVLYDELPEGSLMADDQCLFYKDTLAQGDTMKFNIKFKNIYLHPMDSVLVRTQVVKDGGFLYDSSAKYKPLQVGDSFYISGKFDTKDMRDANQLIITVNPDMAQPEITLDNNYYNQDFYVETDRFNPILDVTFDDKHIRNGEIIRPDPIIGITAKDENRIWPLNDTSYIRLWLLRLNDTMPVYFSNPAVSFTPAATADMWAKVVYKPNLAPGIYTLYVQVSDRSGNKAGTVPYSIDFVVTDKSGISRLYLYPNPVTAESRFHFVIAGSDVPDDMSINIFDAAGHWLRKIQVNEIMKLSAGDNEFSWNGSDASGNPLLSGVYIFKATARKGGKDLPVYVPENNELFPMGENPGKSYGRMLIIR